MSSPSNVTDMLLAIIARQQAALEAALDRQGRTMDRLVQLLGPAAVERASDLDTPARSLETSTLFFSHHSFGPRSISNHLSLLVASGVHALTLVCAEPSSAIVPMRSSTPLPIAPLQASIVNVVPIVIEDKAPQEAAQENLQPVVVVEPTLTPSPVASRPSSPAYTPRTPVDTAVAPISIPEAPLVVEEEVATICHDQPQPTPTLPVVSSVPLSTGSLLSPLVQLIPPIHDADEVVVGDEEAHQEETLVVEPQAPLHPLLTVHAADFNNGDDGFYMAIGETASDDHFVNQWLENDLYTLPSDDPFEHYSEQHELMMQQMQSPEYNMNTTFVDAESSHYDQQVLASSTITYGSENSNQTDDTTTTAEMECVSIASATNVAMMTTTTTATIPHEHVSEPTPVVRQKRKRPNTNTNGEHARPSKQKVPQWRSFMTEERAVGSNFKFNIIDLTDDYN